MSVAAPERRPLLVPEEPAREARAGLRPVIAAGLAAAGAAWMAAGLFRGAMPHVIALAGVALGAGLVGLSTRTRRPSLVQYLVFPAAIVAGALLVLPETGAGGANVISLIAEALRAGGLRQPPLAFDPGWRFLLFVLPAALAAGGASLALSSGRPRLAVLVPAPVLLGAALLQPEQHAVAASAVGIAFVLAALAVSTGADLADAGATGARFETRRLARGAALALALVAGIVALNRASVLFPETSIDRVVPAQRPPADGSIGADRVLFTVEAGTAGPWRLGVLDVYDGSGWLLPPFDPGRLQPIDGAVPGAPEADRLVTARITAADVPGHVLPGLANPVSVQVPETVELDPRTGVLRLVEQRVPRGLTYTITAPAAPGGRALAAAPAPAEELAAFLDAPPPPNQVVSLLEAAPGNPWDRLVFVRARLFEQVIAAGAGRPVDVPPARVGELLAGSDATPYEITAAEALLARWAGVPSRIGFGFHGGDPLAGGAVEVRPRHAATWLEVWFEGHGWVPVLGVPPRARASLSPGEQQDNPNVLPTDELALIVHVPIRLESRLLLFVTVRWWLARVLPVLAGAVLVWWLAPGALKLLRRARRRRWAARAGPAARILTAYAEVREAATDLGMRGATLTPLAFLEHVERDDEHAELGWLVTRALWGDLRRDLQPADADRAEAMARSVARRLRRAQPAGMRLLAFASRASLRDPYSREVPNLWPRLRARPALAGAALLMVTLAACAQGVGLAGEPGTLPARAVPDRLEDLVFQREQAAEAAYEQAGPASLVHEGRLWTVRRDGEVQASVQVASFVAGIDTLDDEHRDAILASFALGSFTLERLGEERVYVQQLPEQRMYLTFTPDGRAFTLMVARRSFVDADQTFLDILRHQRGDPTGARGAEPPAHDPRRGTR